MGIDVRLETEQAEPIGETLHDHPRNYLAQALATAKGSCTGLIDPYGNTLFNQLQLPVLIKDLEALAPTLPSHLAAHVHDVLNLLRPGLNQPHVYARFIGD